MEILSPLQRLARKGKIQLEFDKIIIIIAKGIGVHPLNKKVYIVDHRNHLIQILNPDLTFSSSFGSRGSNNGQFYHPAWDVAFDSTGNVYIICG